MSPTTGYKAMIGLRKKDTYEELINYLHTDQEIIRYPDRYAKQLRESPYLTQLDGEGLGEMQEQRERQFIEEQRENTIRQVASATNKSVSQIRAETAHRESFSQTETVAPDVKMSATSDTQTDNPVMANSGTGTDDNPPRPGAGAMRTKMGGSGPLPPQHHYEHLNSNQPPPPPPAPESQRIRKSTSDASTQDDLIAHSGGQPPPPFTPSQYGKAQLKRTPKHHTQQQHHHHHLATRLHHHPHHMNISLGTLKWKATKTELGQSKHKEHTNNKSYGKTLKTKVVGTRQQSGNI